MPALARIPALLLLLLVSSRSGVAQTGPPAGPSGSSSAPSLEQGIYTEEQADAGGRDFETICTDCHGGFDLLSPNLSMKWTGRTLWELYERIKNTMPENDPGFLDTAQAARLVAYLLGQQGFPSGERALEPDEAALAGIVIHRPANPVP